MTFWFKKLWTNRKSVVSVTCLLTLLACSAAPVKELQPVPASTSERKVFTGTLKVMTLNAAHGRKDGANQLFLSGKKIHSNLGDVAAFLKQSGADVIALQEADGPSRWSGKFDHVIMLAQQAEYPWHCRVGHAQSWLFDYGTALLSRGYFIDTLGHSFEPTPPTTTKGFLLGQVVWQPIEGSQTTILVDIVSVHLDFSSEKSRQSQVREIAEYLSGRKNPIIILGDFNSEWLDEESIIEELARRTGLHGYMPKAKDLGTFRSNGRRLDWILISNELQFKSYSVLPDVVSDHYAVVAEVGVRANVKIKEVNVTDLTTEINPCKGDEICNTCASPH